MADGRVVINVDLDGKKAQSEVGTLKGLLNSLGNTSASGFGKGSRSAFGFGAAVGIASGLVQKGLSTISNSLSGAVSRVDTMNRFPMMMKAMGFSANDAKSSIEALSKGIDGLPTALDDVVGTTQQLALMNGDLNKSTKLTLALNDAFLASGSSSADASRGLVQFSQMMSSGTVDLQSWKTLMETMPLGLQKTAEAFGFAGSSAKKDLYDALKKGSITFDQFSDKLIELDGGLNGFAKLARVNSIGIATSFTNLKTAVTRGLANMITKFDEAAKSKGLGGIAQNLNKVKDVINKAFNATTPFVEAFVDLLAKCVSNIKKFYEIFGGTGAISAAKSAFELVGKAIKHVYESLQSSGDIITPIAITIGDAFIKVAGYVSKVANFISKLNPKTIKIVAGAVLGAVAAFKSLQMAVSVVNGLSNAFGLLKLAMSNPILLAIAGIGMLVGALVTAYNTNEKFRAKVNEVASAIKRFIDSLNPEQLKQWGLVIASVVSGFAAFKMLNGWNPFTIFGKKGKKALGEVDDSLGNTSKKTRKTKGVIEQTLTGLGNVFVSFGKGLSLAFEGAGKGLQLMLQGLKGLNPATIISFGASIGIAAVGIGAGIAIISAGLTLLATQSQGVSQIILSLGTALGTLASMVIGALADAIVKVSTVLPTIAQSFVMMTPVITAVASAISMIISSFGSLTPVIIALTPIISIISNTFVQLASIVADAIVRIVQALAPFLPSVVNIVNAVAPILSQLIDSFNNLVNNLSPIIDSITSLFKTLGEQIRNILDGAKGVIESFGKTVRSILDGISGIFDSIGNAALNAGKGFKYLAEGVVMITDTRLGDMAASLTAVAVGVGKIASKGAGLSEVGNGMKNLATGMMIFSTASTLATTAFNNLPTAITNFNTSLSTIQTNLTIAQTAITNFATGSVTSLAGLTAINVSISAFSSSLMSIIPTLSIISASIITFNMTLMTINPSFAMANAGLMSFNANASATGSALSVLGNNAISASAQISNMGVTISTVMSGASSTILSAGANMSASIQNAMAQMVSSVQSAGNRMIIISQSTVNQMKNVYANGMNNIVSSIRNGGSQMVTAFSSAGNRLVTTAQSMVNRTVSIVRSGHSQMVTAGNFLGQGLAAGMRSALGEVTSAANALVAQAERAARAKAKIKSPSRLFRDEVGYWLGAGVAAGIDKSSSLVDKSISDIYNNIEAFKIKPEDLLGVGKTSFSNQVISKVRTDDTSRIVLDNNNAKNEEHSLQNISLLSKLIDKVSELESAIDRGKQIVLDTGELVGATTNSYDHSLGLNANLGRRHKF